jgi:hypothetical protein
MRSPLLPASLLSVWGKGLLPAQIFSNASFEYTIKISTDRGVKCDRRIQYNIFDKKDPKRGFRLVIATKVLEHLDNPEKTPQRHTF